MTVRFAEVRDWGSDAYYRSNKLNNGDFDYWLIGHLMYLPDFTSDFTTTYHASIMAVAPSEVPDDRRDDAIASSGINDNEWERVENGDIEYVAFLLAEAGIGAQLWNAEGNNKNELLKKMRKEAQLIECFFGFYMDRPENMIGSNGWDFIKGDIMAGLDRWKEKRNEVLG